MKRQELRHALKDMFQTADASGGGDGLSIEEWTDMVKERFPGVSESDIKMEYQEADKNSNGKVTFKEFRAYMKKLIKQADKDEDLDLSE